MSALQQLKELYEASTIKGRKVATFDTIVFIDSGLHPRVCQASGFNSETDPDNIKLIAAALNALPALIRVVECADEVVWHAGDLLQDATVGEDARQAIDNLTDALLGVGGEA